MTTTSAEVFADMIEAIDALSNVQQKVSNLMNAFHPAQLDQKGIIIDKVYPILDAFVPAGDGEASWKAQQLQNLYSYTAQVEQQLAAQQPAVPA